jgi:hypothetical protein
MSKPGDKQISSVRLRVLRSCAIEGCRFVGRSRCALCGVTACAYHSERVRVADLEMPSSLRHDAPRRLHLWICLRCQETLRAQALQERAVQAARRLWIIRTSGAPIYDLHLYRHYRQALWPYSVPV